jgi:hypothetical protein
MSRLLFTDWHSPGSRNEGFSCYNVTPLPESHCSTLLTAVYKRPLKEEEELFAFGFHLGFLLWALALGFGFGLFGMGSFRKGKELLKGKEWLKENC